LHEPIDCATVQEVLEPYLDGELVVIRSHQVEVHLEDCSACLAQMHLASEIRNELRALPELDAPVPLVQAIYDDTVHGGSSRPATDRPLRPWLRPAWIALAAASLVLVLGWAISRSFIEVIPQQPDSATIARATAEARFALAQVGRATHKAGVAVRDRTLHQQIVRPAREGLSRALGRDPEIEGRSHQGGVDDV
jgi:anti-sigma factor RsiW